MSDPSDEPESILTSSRAMSRQETLRLLGQKKAAILASSSSSESVDPEELIGMARRASTQAAAAGRGKNQKRARLDAFTQEKLSLSLSKARKRGKRSRERDEDGEEKEGEEEKEDGELVEIQVELGEEDEEDDVSNRRHEEEEREELHAVLHPEAPGRPLSATERAMQESAARSARTMLEARKAEQRVRAREEMAEVAPTAIVLHLRERDTGTAHVIKVRPTDLWGRVAEAACGSLGMPRQQVQFLLDGRVLSDGATVEDCLLAEGDEVEVAVKDEYRRAMEAEKEEEEDEAGGEENNGGDETLLVKLRDAKGKTVQLAVHQDDTVARVIEAYKKQVQGEAVAARLALQFDGDMCGEEVTLRDLGIESDDMLDVVVRMK